MPERRSQVTYDGEVKTGLVIKTERGFEAHSEGHGYLATYPSMRSAAKAIAQRHRDGAEGDGRHGAG